MNDLIRDLIASTRIKSVKSVTKENLQVDRKVSDAEESINRFSDSLAELNEILQKARKYEESQPSNESRMDFKSN